MYIDWLNEARELERELFALRRGIHSKPELGNREFETAATAEKFLNGLGIETFRLTDTAVMGVLSMGGAGKTAALRCDMDALPIEEETEAQFASKVRGVMHACGHDVHTSALLGAAKLLNNHRSELNGTVKFFLQPDEEGDGGAERMIAAGCMENPAVDAVFGGHVSPDLPLGTIGVRYGGFYAASNMFTVRVTGKSAHGAQPEKGIDALYAAAEMVSAAKTLLKRKNYPRRAVISVGTLSGGTAGNIIADRAEFSGIIRAFGTDSRKKVTELLKDEIENISRRCGTAVQIDVKESYPGVVNSDNMTDVVLCAVENMAGGSRGEIRAERLENPTMTTEDFGCFLSRAPGSFYHIGTGGDYPLHSPDFLPDDRAVSIAAAVHAAVIAEFLGG